MTRRKLLSLTVAGAFAAAVAGMIVIKRNEPTTSQDPAASAQDAQRPADTTPTQIQEAPRSTQDVFTPPPTHATGSSPAPK